MKRTNWLWGRKANWENFLGALSQTPWRSILTGDVGTQIGSFTSTVHSLQNKYIPNPTFTLKPHDHSWFGYDCRVAADNKSKAWRRYKRHPTQANKQLHKAASDNIRRILRLAQQQWQDELRSKL
ncbi:uncharacterized protein LOC135105136 isoform X1 [Scylla paramamosain]|uniref:uncharacterized protein LOC135105136 isoform X1 n=1 Tax=Scylla paramamosain TaxID=85552 RepID=UPI0030826D40